MEKRGEHESMKQADKVLLPLSSMELSIWLGQQRHVDLPLYNMGMLFEIRGGFDVKRFDAAFKELVVSNEVMRSVIFTKGLVPYIEVLEEVPVNIDYLDFSQESDALEVGKRYFQRKCRELIDIGKCNFDVSVAKIADDIHYWFLNQHHLFTDIASLELIYREVSEKYLHLDQGMVFNGFSDTERSVDPVVSGKSISQKQKQCELDLDKKRRINLYGVSRSQVKSKALRIESSLGPSLMASISTMIEMPEYRTLSLDLTRFCLISTGIAAYLSRVSDQKDLMLACPTQNRSSPSEKNTLGMFIQMLPFQVICSEEDTFSSLYPRIRAAAIEYMMMAVSGTGNRSELRNINIVWNMIQTPATLEECLLPHIGSTMVISIRSMIYEFKY